MIELPDKLDETLLSLVRDEGAFDVIQGATNLIGYFLDANDQSTKDSIIKLLWHCSQKVAKDLGLAGSLYSLLNINAVASIAQAAEIGERYAQYCFGLFHYGQKKEEQVLLASNSYAVVAALCINRIKPYSDSDAAIVEMAAQLYATMHLSREEQ